MRLEGATNDTPRVCWPQASTCHGNRSEARADAARSGNLPGVVEIVATPGVDPQERARGRDAWRRAGVSRKVLLGTQLTWRRATA